nr:sensor histidine kinase [Lysobacter sp.]
MRRRPGLQRRSALGMRGYMVLLSAVVLAFGWMVNERAEALVWRSLLETEMEYFARHEDDEDWRPRDTGLLEFFVAGPDAALPAGLANLPPGLHDEVNVDGRQIVALVHETGDQRLLLALDITEFERSERELALTLLFSSLVIVLP